MENMNVMEQRSLVDGLTQGMELANQLKNQINPMTSKETCENLLQGILSIYDKALACVNLAELLQNEPLPIAGLAESSDGISTKIGCAKDHSARDFKKRAYYRCTHKHSRGCGATKQLQQTEKDPLIFEVTYKGTHTCMDAPNSSSSVVSQEEKSKYIINNFKQLEPEQMQKQNIPFQFGQCLEVENEEINSKVVRHISSFSYLASSIQSENQDNWEQFEEQFAFARLASPATSESNYISGTIFDMDMDPVEDVLNYFTSSE